MQFLFDKSINLKKIIFYTWYAICYLLIGYYSWPYHCSNFHSHISWTMVYFMSHHNVWCNIIFHGEKLLVECSLNQPYKNNVPFTPIFQFTLQCLCRRSFFLFPKFLIQVYSIIIILNLYNESFQIWKKTLPWNDGRQQVNRSLKEKEDQKKFNLMHGWVL